MLQSELKQKRKLLLEKSTSLENAGQHRKGQDIDKETERRASPSDIADDIIVLNEEADDLDQQIHLNRRQLHQLSKQEDKLEYTHIMLL